MQDVWPIPARDATPVRSPGNRFPGGEGAGGRAAGGRRRGTLASASSCKSFHNPAPVAGLQGRDDKDKLNH